MTRDDKIKRLITTASRWEITLWFLLSWKSTSEGEEAPGQRTCWYEAESALHTLCCRTCGTVRKSLWRWADWRWCSEGALRTWTYSPPTTSPGAKRVDIRRVQWNLSYLIGQGRNPKKVRLSEEQENPF